MRKNIIFLIVAFISFHLFLEAGKFFIKPEGIDRVEVLNDGWDVCYNDTEFKDVKLSELRKLIGNGTKRGDRLTFVKKDLDISGSLNPTLMLETRFSTCKVSVDGKEIERKYIYDFIRGDYIGCSNNFISLPRTYGISELSIEMLVAEDGAYNYYRAPVVGEYIDLYLYEVYSNLFVFMSSAFLIIFGFIFFVIALGFQSNLPEIKMLTFSALLFIDLGVWFLTQFEVLHMFVDFGRTQTEVEYISLYLVVPLMYMVMGGNGNYFKKKRFMIVAVISTLIAIVPIFLHFVKVVHINQMLTLYQVNALGLYIFMIAMIYNDEKNKRVTKPMRIQLIGQGMLAFSFLFNVFFYYLEVFGISEQVMFSKKIVPVGTMCMVFATLVNYNIYISESLARKKEYESLAHFAYADGLTDLPNRSKFEKHIGDLAKRGDDYCVISIDLNGLKAVNDIQGHLMGDKYLREFGSVLKESIGERGFIARIGGDEFAAVLQGENIGYADEVIKCAEYELNRLNLEDLDIERSAAFGYAYKHEVESNDWRDVYLLADERMYVRKSEMKKAK